jgi:hypothetical protein
MFGISQKLHLSLCWLLLSACLITAWPSPSKIADWAVQEQYDTKLRVIRGIFGESMSRILFSNFKIYIFQQQEKLVCKSAHRTEIALQESGAERNNATTSLDEEKMIHLLLYSISSLVFINSLDLYLL